ncbi:uncharacterized protein LOC111717449 [Eurytemora carolleeae]|uniref:uncharacterized protein LOC111717449 n=1 Tax=Eurytemora carolleeae TaxID=1294199 RepID=UPI000C765E0C|nr:uncharacterized protein LOC111717449 [Eurytemora carolleeae]|eukprot:XP_023348720.1 uncharacterized protein LOC111717449 [Eurytemora affinis]
MPCSLKILHLNLSEYNLEINKKKLLSILNGSHQIFTILYDVSSTSRSNPVVSLNQETYILLSKQPNKDTSKDPLFWSSVLDILKCKQPCGLKILQRQLTTNYPDIDNRLLLNMLREYPDRFTLQFGNDSNPWIALNSEMSEVPKQELAANVAPGSYAAEGMPANVKICLVPDQRKKQEKLSIAPIKANESGGNFNKTKKPRKQKKKKLNIEPKKDKEERIQQPKGTMKIFPSTQEISRSMNKKDGQKKRMDLLRHKQEARENGHSGKQMKPEIKVHSKFGLREFS